MSKDDEIKRLADMFGIAPEEVTVIEGPSYDELIAQGAFTVFYEKRWTKGADLRWAITPGSKFDLGTVLITPGADRYMRELGMYPTDILMRHAEGDWGDLDAEDKDMNEYSLRNGARLMSSYKLGEGRDEKLWVLTDAYRSVTTIMLPSEY